MSFNLIFGLIFMLMVSTSEGANWIGTFVIQGACNATACCCPPNSLVFANISNVITSNFSPTGKDCPKQNISIIDPSQNFAVGIDHSNFTLSNSDNTLEVFLNQNDTNQPAECKVTMLRSKSSGGGGGGGSSSGNGNQPPSRNDAFSNHGSIVIKFISIIMTTIFITHI